jgi:hypothetical protein
MVHIIEYILYSSVEFVSSKHCNYSGRVNWVEGIKRSIGSFNQISIQRIWKTTPKFILHCYVIIPIGKLVISSYKLPLQVIGYFETSSCFSSSKYIIGMAQNGSYLSSSLFFFLALVPAV